jgi:hypothetical protein
MKPLYESLLDDEEEIISKHKFVTFEELEKTKDNPNKFHSVMDKIIKCIIDTGGSKIHMRNKNYEKLFDEHGGGYYLFYDEKMGTAYIGYIDMFSNLEKSATTYWGYRKTQNGNKVVSGVHPSMYKQPIYGFDAYRLSPAYAESYLEFFNKYYKEEAINTVKRNEKLNRPRKRISARW